MKLSSSILLTFLLSVGTPALAETAAERAACTPDVWRLCASEIPDIGAIKTCLRRERAKLGAACRVVMDNADKPIQTASNRAAALVRQ